MIVLPCRAIFFYRGFIRATVMRPVRLLVLLWWIYTLILVLAASSLSTLRTSPLATNYEVYIYMELVPYGGY